MKKTDNEMFQEFMDSVIKGKSLPQMSDDIKSWVHSKDGNKDESCVIHFYYYMARVHKKLLIEVNDCEETDTVRLMRLAWTAAWMFYDLKRAAYKESGFELMPVPIKFADTFRDQIESGRKVDTKFIKKLLDAMEIKNNDTNAENTKGTEDHGPPVRDS